MKQFKLNALEKFVIRYKKIINIFLLLIFFLSRLISDICNNYEKKPIISLIQIAVLIVFWTYTDLMPELKNSKAVKAHQKLDIEYALEGISKLIDAENSTDSVYAPVHHINKVSFLIDMGRFDEAQEEIKTIFQIFDARKLPPQTLFSIHLNCAKIKLLCNDEEAYKAQLSIVESYYDQFKTSKLKSAVYRAYNGFTDLLNCAFAFNGTYDEQFEQKVLTDIKFYGGKEKKKGPNPLDCLNAYFYLFTYFNRFGNTDKAVYYAHKITEIGNSGFLAYRIAKEYLTNADKFN